MESMINYVHEKLKKLGAERLMDKAKAKLKGIGAVTGLMTNFQEKIKKTGADGMVQVKLKGMEAVSLMKNVLEKLNKTTEQYDEVNYLQKKFGWELKNTKFIIIFVAVLVLLVFLLGFILSCCRGTAGKTMKAPGRKSTMISRHKFESNPRSYFGGLRGKKKE